MMSRGVYLVALVAFAAVAAGCTQATCSQSGDIQVTVAPNSDVSIPEIARLHVMLSVADGPVRVLMPDIDLSMHPLSPSGGSAFVLHPDTPPPMDKYDVSLTVQALDGDGNLLAIGSESMQALIKGCNLLTVHLAALPVMQPGPDMAAPPGSDLAGMLPTDMTTCVGGMPDEDGDGRANFCDLCPADADPTPVDTDGDGLPDACDPDPMMKTNTLVYFEPFDVASGHWPGGNPVRNSYMTVDAQGNGQIATSNATDMLPANVRVQSYMFLNGFYNTTNADAGLIVSTTTNLASATDNGAWCLISSSDGKLELYAIKNGATQQPSLANLGGMPTGLYRLRLTNSNGNWTCELLGSSGGPLTVTATQAVTGPLFVTLIVDASAVNYHSVVAETKL